jgi:uncharacterized protein (DUF983 family)
VKLVLCPRCGDLFKLSTNTDRACECGSSWGRYRPDGVRAVIGGQAIPIGLLSLSLARAVRRRPVTGEGERFEAFVIPHACPTVTHQDKTAEAIA